MKRQARLMRVLLMVGTAATLLIGGGGPGAASPESADRARQCSVPSGLAGRPVQIAERLIREAGCRGVIIILNKCASQEEFGLVVAGPRPSGRIPFKHQITLWRGVVGDLCDELPDASSGVTRYDGAYSASILVVGPSTLPEGAVGITITGFSFTVTDGRMSGDVSGAVDANGLSANASAAKDGYACRGTMRFSDGRATGAMECMGDRPFNGVLTALRS